MTTICPQYEGSVKNLLVAGHGGVEDDLAGVRAGGPEGLAGEHESVLGGEFADHRLLSAR